MGFPGGTDSKESACSVEDMGSIPGSGRSPGEGNGCPLQYSCLENSMDRGAWQTTVHGVAKKLDTTERHFSQIRIQFTGSWDLNEDVFSRKTTIYSLYYTIQRLI